MASASGTEPPRARRLPPAFLCAVPLLLAAAVFYPITDNYFFGDDLLNLYRIVNWGFTRYVLAPYAGHILVVRNAVFFLCFELFGPAPRAYFWLVLLTHLLNVFLLFRVIATFTGSARLACFGAALWGAAPMNEGTLGWYSVYGQVLVATGMLWLLAGLGRVARGAPLPTATLIAWALVAVAISTLFGTGIGVALALPAAAFLLLPAGAPRTRAVLALGAAALAVPLLYYGLHALAHAQHWGMPAVPPRRLLALWPVLVDIFARLLAFGSASLLLGAFAAPVDLAAAATQAALLLLLLLLVAAAVSGGGALRRLLLACALLAASGYAMIVLGRGGMVGGGVNPLRIVTAGRYHYLAPLAVTIALCAALAVLGRRRRAPGAAGDLLLVAALALIVGLRMYAGAAIDHHQVARRQTEEAVQRLRQAIAAAPAGRDLYLQLSDEVFLGVGPMLARWPQHFPGWAGVFAVFFPDDVVDGRRVRFVTSDLRVLKAAAGGRRSAALFVRPSDVPADQPVIVP